MYELFNILERHGIIRMPDIAKVAGLPAKTIEKLHHDIYTNIFDAQNDRIWGKSSPPTDTFSFHASASLRGDSGCSAVLCHLNKLDFLARYAALYANELTFPLTMVRPKPDQSISVVRDWLEHDLLSLLFLRPLIRKSCVPGRDAKPALYP